MSLSTYLSYSHMSLLEASPVCLSICLSIHRFIHAVAAAFYMNVILGDLRGRILYWLPLRFDWLYSVHFQRFFLYCVIVKKCETFLRGFVIYNARLSWSHVFCTVFIDHFNVWSVCLKLRRSFLRGPEENVKCLLWAQYSFHLKQVDAFRQEARAQTEPRKRNDLDSNSLKTTVSVDSLASMNISDILARTIFIWLMYDWWVRWEGDARLVESCFGRWERETGM